MDSATSRTPSQPCGMQMLTSEHVTDKCHARVATFLLPQRKFANLGAHREYIAAGDSQAAVPFPTEIGRDFDLQ